MTDYWQEFWFDQDGKILPEVFILAAATAVGVWVTTRTSDETADEKMYDLAAKFRRFDQSYIAPGYQSGRAGVGESAFVQPDVAQSLKDLEAHREQVAANPSGSIPFQMEQAEAEIDLVYHWLSGDDDGLHFRGEARISPDGWMELTDGAFWPTGVNEKLLAACRESHQLSLETVFTADETSQSESARLITFSSHSQSRNFSFGRQGNRLVFQLRTSHHNRFIKGSDPAEDEGLTPSRLIELAEIVAGEMYHVVITYRPGQLFCFLNGQLVLETDAVQGDFSNWSPQHLIFGDEWTGGRNWQGRLGSVAIFSRAMNAEEANLRYRLQQLLESN